MTADKKLVPTTRDNSLSIIVYKQFTIEHKDNPEIVYTFDDDALEFVPFEKYLTGDDLINNNILDVYHADVKSFLGKFNAKHMSDIETKDIDLCTSYADLNQYIYKRVELEHAYLLTPHPSKRFMRIIAQLMNRTVNARVICGDIDDVLYFKGSASKYYYNPIRHWNVWEAESFTTYMYVQDMFNDKELESICTKDYKDYICRIERLRKDVNDKYGIVTPRNPDGSLDLGKITYDLARYGYAYELDFDLRDFPKKLRKYYRNGYYTGKGIVLMDPSEVYIEGKRDPKLYEFITRVEEQWLYLAVYRKLGIEPDTTKYKACEVCGTWMSLHGAEFCPFCDTPNPDYYPCESRDMQFEINASSLYDDASYDTEESAFVNYLRDKQMENSDYADLGVDASTFTTYDSRDYDEWSVQAGTADALDSKADDMPEEYETIDF